MKSMGFRICNSDQAVFLKGEGEETEIIAAVVDDLTIVANTVGQIDQIKQQLHANF
jgi:hypothetical protein